MQAFFSERLIAWQKIHGRHNLPWQVRNPYLIWVSEIMLQQTQVTTVIPYYQRFIEAFPNVARLAEASQDEVLAFWSGLGYYARARNLHTAAKQIMTDFGGIFPESRQSIEALKGIGRSTAAAIAVFAYGKKEAICDGNVRRVLSRYHGFSADLSKQKNLKLMWDIAENNLPHSEIMPYTQGLMDLGSLICKRSAALCEQCPLSKKCVAFAQGNPLDYPVKIKRTKVNQMDGFFLMLEDAEGNIFLERRPASGIWGGLWSLPWFESQDDAKNWLLRQNIDTEIKFPSKATLRHKFTHIDLKIYLAKTVVSHSKLNFLSRQEIKKYALPTAIQKILIKT